MQDWYLYIVRCKDGSLYTGITTDVERRFSEHRSGKGSKYLRGRSPLTLVFQKKLGSKNLALAVENKVKNLTKAQKEELLVDETRLDKIIAAYLNG
jgi:putative endonuclease